MLTQRQATELVATSAAADEGVLGPVVDPLAKIPEDKRDLGRAYIELQKKQIHHRRRWRYYKGDHPLVFSTERLREVFLLENVRFAENWCKIVVNSAASRVQLLRFAVAGAGESEPGPDARLEDIYSGLSLGIEADDVHKEADITGEAFLIAWKNEGEDVEVYRQPAHCCHMFYDAAQPRKKAYAAKWFDRGEKKVVVLYYPDRVETWRSTVERSSLREFSDRQWELDAGDTGDGIIDNPFEEVPVFHFRLGGFGESELDDAIPIQDMINKLISDLMVTAEFAAFPMRWAITNQDLEGLKAAPHIVWQFEPGDGDGQQSQTGEYTAAPLENFLKVIDSFAAAMAVITSTPKHLFFGAIGNPSGEALLALEAPLVNKVTGYIERFSVVWREFASFVLKIDGLEVARDEIEPIFGPVQTISPMIQATVRSTNVAAGMPLRSILRLEGMSENDIAQIDEDRGLDELVAVKSPDQLQAERDAAIAAAVTNLEPLLGDLMEGMAQSLVAKMATSGTLAKLLAAGAAAKAPATPVTGSEGS